MKRFEGALIKWRRLGVEADICANRHLKYGRIKRRLACGVPQF